MSNLLIATSESTNLEFIEIAAAEMELGVEIANDVATLLERANSELVEMVLLDAGFSSSTGLEIYRQLADNLDQTPGIKNSYQ